MSNAEINVGVSIDAELTLRGKLLIKLAELKSDKRLTYKTADIFTNAPLALIQCGLESQVHLLESLLELPLSSFPLPKQK